MADTLPAAKSGMFSLLAQTLVAGNSGSGDSGLGSGSGASGLGSGSGASALAFGETGNSGPPSLDVAMLCVSFLLFAVSIYVFLEATRLHNRLFHPQKDIWNATADAFVPIGIGFLVGVWWFLAVPGQLLPEVLTRRPDHLSNAVIVLFLLYPGKVFPAFCFASVLPTVIAVLKFSGVYFFSRHSQEPDRDRRVVMGFGGMLISLVNLVGSVATIISFIENHSPR